MKYTNFSHRMNDEVRIKTFKRWEKEIATIKETKFKEEEEEEEKERFHINSSLV